MKIKKVAVFYGGNSSEREVSINTSAQIVNALQILGYETTEIDTKTVTSRKETWLQIISKLQDVDFVFLALHGGEGENGIIQGLLSTLGIPFSGSSVLGSAAAMDKDLTKKICVNIGVPTASWKVFLSSEVGKINVGELVDFGFPFVVKPNDEGSTVGLSIVKNENEILEALQNAAKCSKKILVEKYISGRELTAGILGETALPIVEIKPKGGFYDYKSKYTSGMSEYEVPAKISETVTKKIQEASVKIAKALDCEVYSRVDFRLDKNDNFFCLEVNTLPGMTSTSLVPKAAKAIGISFPELIGKILELSLEKKM
ncbi:D-alanine--D-alanine ligase [bacterium]|nr:D-alanine--D-alanine ligase [bacterium]